MRRWARRGLAVTQTPDRRLSVSRDESRYNPWGGLLHANDPLRVVEVVPFAAKVRRTHAQAAAVPSALTRAVCSASRARVRSEAAEVIELELVLRGCSRRRSRALRQP